jgi:hypothetical protein
VSTQLRLVEPPAKSVPTRAAKNAAKSVKEGARIAPKSRRAANWGDWRLDARTRRVGREGVAAARRALESAERSAHDGEKLSRAS